MDPTSGRSIPGSPGSKPPSASSLQPNIRGYQITGRLGEGGMGIVWGGIQLSTKRRVAIKLLSAAGFGSEKSRTRFAREVELAASLQHPNIARVYDSGIDQGVYFYAMELIDGYSLDRYVEKNKLGRKDILSLMRLVCLAMQHAHQRGVIHRDLKPTNILISEDGQPHILDFGLAKDVLNDAQKQVSQAGDLSGTPAYMSPEQAAGRPDRVDTRADVYSLGVILYRLLTGKAPQDLTGSYLTVLKRIAEDEVIRPRAALTDIDTDLEAILLKALAKQPEERYASAGDLAADIQNYLDGEPINAVPATTAYFLRKRFRKHRGRFLAAAGVVVILLAMAVLAYVRVRAERDRADQNALDATDAKEQADAKNQQLIEAKAQADKARDEANQARDQANQARDQAVKALADAEAARQGESVAHLAATQATAGEHQAKAGQQQALTEAQQQRDLANQAAANEKAARDSAMQLEHAAEIRLVDALAAQANAETLANDPVDARRLYDQAWKEAERLQVPTEPIALGILDCERLHPSPLGVYDDADRQDCRASFGRMMASISATDHRTIVCWDAMTGRKLGALTGHKDDVSTVRISSSGRFAASVDKGGHLMIWSFPQGKLLRDIAAHTGAIRCVDISPDESMVATGGIDDHMLKVFALPGGRMLWSAEHTDELNVVCFTPDGKHILSNAAKSMYGADTSIHVHTVDGADAGPIPFYDRVFSMAVSPDSTFVAYTSGGNNLQAASLDTKAIVPGFATSAWLGGMTFSPDGKTFLAGTVRGELMQFDPAHMDAPTRTLRGHHFTVDDCGFLDSGEVCWSKAGEAGAARCCIWNLSEPDATPMLTNNASSSSISKDGALVATMDFTHRLNIWDCATGHLLVRGSPADSANPVSSVSFMDGRHIALPSKSTVSICDVYTGAQVNLLHKPQELANIGGLTVSADGTRLAAGEQLGTVFVWDLRTGQVQTFPPDNYTPYRMSFMPDNRMLVVVTRNGTRVLDTNTGQVVRTLDAPGRRVVALDDTHVIVSSFTNQSAVWDINSGQSGATYETSALAETIAVSPDGSRIVGSDQDGNLCVWSPDAPRPIFKFHYSLTTATHLIGHVRFRADGTFLTGDETSVYLWDLNRARTQRDLLAKAQAAQATLQDHPNDKDALLALGQWYEFRGAWAWATILLEQARSAGADVSDLSLARDYWQMGDLQKAAQEFQIALSHKEADADYLNLCIQAVANPPARN